MPCSASLLRKRVVMSRFWQLPACAWRASALAAVAAGLGPAGVARCDAAFRATPLPADCADVRVVGGHAGMLQSAARPLVYKPLQSGDRGRAELQFYEEVAQRPSSAPPRCFMPAYHGIAHDGDENSRRLFLILEDLARPFRRPCVLDVKVGVRTWGDDAPPEKIAAELRKFPLQQRVGFRLTGMRVWDAVGGTYREHGRAYGYSLDEASLHCAFAEFLYDGRRVRRELVPPLLAHLRAVQAWFHAQSE